MAHNVSASKLKTCFTRRRKVRTSSAQEADVARTTPITDLITARRQLDGASQILAKGRNEMQNWGTDMKWAWQDLEKKQLQLRETFIRFNHFVKENHEKRERAKQKIERENEIQLQQEQELRDIEKQLSGLQLAEEELNVKLREYDIYRSYLTQVVEKSTELTDVQAVLSRYDTLTWTRKELGDQQAEALGAVQTSRELLTKEADKQAQLMIGLHTKLADLRVRHEAARTYSTKWENIQARLKAFAAEKAVEIEQVRAACWNLYKTICKLRKEPEMVAQWDTEQQLVQITRRIQHLHKVTNMVNNKLGKLEPVTNTNIVTSTIVHMQ